MNSAMSSLPSVALITGPTASGKSAIAAALARLIGGTVVNADASQVYADLAILSARPSAAEMAGVPHRLFGHVDGAEACSAARWAADARGEIDRIHGAGGIPVLAGGTGLYIRTLIDGIAPVPTIDPAIRDAVRAMPVAEAHAALSREDAEAAARLNRGDTSRVARALEVVRSTSRPLAAWQAQRSGGIGERVRIVAMVLLPPRDWLAARIAARTAAMIDAGAIGEVAALLARRLPPDRPVMRAIGVPEIAAMIRGDSEPHVAAAAIGRATLRYAKRQRTWFANQSPAHWPRWTKHVDDAAIDEIVTKMRNELLT